MPKLSSVQSHRQTGWGRCWSCCFADSFFGLQKVPLTPLKNTFSDSISIPPCPYICPLHHFQFPRFQPSYPQTYTFTKLSFVPGVFDHGAAGRQDGSGNGLKLYSKPNRSFLGLWQISLCWDCPRVACWWIMEEVHPKEQWEAVSTYRECLKG